MKIEYGISKHRFYELKHFCLQYSKWKEIYQNSDGWNGKGDTTSRDGIKRGDIITFVDLIDRCAQDTNREILPFVTTEGLTMSAEMMFYYRKFFWELSRRR